MDGIEVAQRDSLTTAGSTERCPDCASYTFGEAGAGMMLGYGGALWGGPMYALLVVIGVALWVLFIVGLFEWAGRCGTPRQGPRSSDGANPDRPRDQHSPS
ncbi:hypothetical protein BKA01_007788 [Pseudonocardia eucalypti]|nr:hypothetical protein [Pseudonocardia eucalypti]